MDEDYLTLYPQLAEKAKEWAAGEGLGERFAYGALNAMWPTVVGDLRRCHAEPITRLRLLVEELNG